MIEGVVLKDLQTNTDERGFFREIIRCSDSFFSEGFGQFSHSLMYPGVVKAWHVHPHQVDWWYVPIGVLKVALFDRRSGSPTEGELMEFFLGENHGARVLKIPPGVAHGCKAIGGAAHLFYITSMTYDPKEEGRIAHDDPAIGYDWTKGPAIK
jgi:dTDP-4-dehydrorhamnose 3,5-epimerase